MKIETRMTDRVRVWLLVTCLVVAAAWPLRNLWAQSQDYINGSTMMQLVALGIRIDKIENMINAVLLAMVVNFIAQIVQIKRSRDSRKMYR